MIEIKVPEFGESIQEVQVAAWLKQPGDWVEQDEDVVELETEKASQALSVEEAGYLNEIKVSEGEFAKIGDVLCTMQAGQRPSAPAASEPRSTAAAGGGAAVVDAPVTTASQKSGWIMPAAERALAEYRISADAIKPTGPGGRLQKEDVMRYVHNLGLKPVDPGTAPARPAAEAARQLPPAKASTSVPEFNSPTPESGFARQETIKPMSMIRRTIAARLVEAQQTAALLTTFNEIDMQPVMELRKKYKEPFLARHGVKLGFMSFFAKAAVEALKRYPAINSEIRGTDVISRNYFDIGIAIGGGKGLVVPVLRNVEKLSFAEIEGMIGEFAQRAETNKIQPEELEGGTFTISNGGIYGSLLSTPIVNPPQSGILGLHAIQDRPVAIDGQVVIRPMMYVAVTYDHRIVDGREAVGFLKTIKEVLEEPARLFLEV
jgi:2-oxoglutarate dehydrogenase E2 component (dihydrolipoamide succinyltransferase)